MTMEYSYSSRLQQLLRNAKPYLLVLFMQFGYAGSAIIAKSALNHGMSHYTFAVYRNVIAAAVFAPFALLFDRKVRPRMTTSIFFKILCLGLLEPVIDQNLYYTGMKYTTATFATAMCNILPAITFVMAWIFRMEKVNLKRLHSQAKILGILVTISGAMIMTLLKGPSFGLPWANIHHIDSPSTASQSPPDSHDHIKGSMMIAAGCFCWASFVILQANTLKSYPAGLSLTTLICAMGALEGTVLTLVVEKGNTAIWAINWDFKFLSALYSGIVTSGIGYFISGVIMKDKGPVFVTAFNPLTMVLVALLGSFILSELLDLGRVFGAIVIVVGLYLVVWGKSKDQSFSQANKDQVAPIKVDQELASRNDGTKATLGHDLVKGSAKTPNDESV